jgi:glyoxylase-like metal-dependent hydrolase (beta-lactamase superfamily II)
MTDAPEPALRFPWEAPPTPGEAVEVADGILWLRLPLPMRLDHVNVYALDEGDHWTVVDTGMDLASGREAWAALLAGPLSGKEVGRVVLTHHHPDHVGLLGWFAGRGAEVQATRLGWTLARMLQLDHQDVPPAEQIEFRRRAGMPPDTLAAFARERPFNFSQCTAPIPLGYRAIFEGDVLRLGGRDWRVHFGHGHAPDHVTLWTDDDPGGLVLAGDQIIPGISSNVGVYPSEPDADPLAEWLESCARLRRVAAGADPLVLPGHKLPFRGIDFRLSQLIENHEAAFDRILSTLRDGPRTAAGLFRAIFRREIGAGQYGLALAEAVAHMNHLHQAARVRRSLREGAWMYSAGDAA